MARSRLGSVVFAGIAALLVAIGSVLPWVTVSTPFGSVGLSGTILGVAGGVAKGTVTFLLALVAGACFGISLVREDRLFAGFGVLLALVTAAIALYDLAYVGAHYSGLSIGYGLWLTVLAAIAMFVGSLKTFAATPYGRMSDRPAGVPRSGQPAVQPDAQEYWVEDPFGRHQLRWWDGNRYTDKVMDDDVTSSDKPGRRPMAELPIEPATG